MTFNDYTLAVVGVLALQGDFAEHIAVLHSVKIDAKEIRTIGDLKNIKHLIIPGGESTVISMLMKGEKLDAEIIKRANNRSLAVFGTCAGIIVLAKTIRDDRKVSSLKLLDIAIQRNAYGTQIDSFTDAIHVKGMTKPIDASFIRAPKIVSVGSSVDILAKNGNDPVVVRSGRVLGSTFHAEVHGQAELHRMFLSM